MTRIFRYILVDDVGMAPCPAGGLITLGTCKPAIRRGASTGDWVLGFRPGSLERGMLLWGGRVADVLDHGKYERKHHDRPDAVYREASDGTYQRLRPNYHPTDEQMRGDTSSPVLVFDPAVSRHLDGKAMALPARLAHLAPAGRGHRVSGVGAGDVEALRAWLAGLPVARSVNGSGDIASSRCSREARDTDGDVRAPLPRRSRACS
ncbi:hypothetical protein GCM10022268_19640 [Sphingomonas cynarae]|uniref:Nucleotide modification associated domain-containing protein n=1 Tax=Sphingomonas cynarae TaxID=930197 RepID=A0ABP7DUX2_9SPHN